MRRLAQSTAYTVVFKLFLTSDHVSPATGKTVAITLSKAGAAFGNPNVGASNATEIANGWYKFALDTTDTGTLGDLVLVGTATACDTADILMQIVSATTGGFTNLDATVSSRASQTTLDAVDDFVDTEVAAIKVQTDKLTFTVANQLDVNVLDWKSATAPAMTGDAFARLGAPVGASVSADIGAVKAVLPASLVSGRIDASVGAMAANVITATAIAADAITDAKVASDVTIASVTGSVGSVVGLTASNLDATVSSRLATAGYTAPLDAAGTRTAVGLATANLDTQIGDLPTNAELATALGTADDAVLAAVAALNNLSAAGIRTAVGLATANLDTQLSSIAGYVDTEIGSLVTDTAAIKAKTDNLPASPAAVGSAMTLTSGERNSVADALLDRADAIEVGVTPRQATRIELAATGGKVSGAATATNTFRNAVADSKDRIVATVDTDGNRTAITYDLT